MSAYYPDEHPAFDIPEFNPEPIEEDFPLVHDIEYVGGIRVSRAVYWKNGWELAVGWACEHGQAAFSPEETAARCVQYCYEKETQDG